MTTRPLTFGMDVEFLLLMKRKNRAVPACGLFGGTKKNPIQVPFEDNGIMMQEDGACLELNCPPCNTVGEWAMMARRLGSAAKRLADEKGLRVSRASDELFSHIPYKKKYARMFVVGCDPDFDAFREGQQRRVFDIEEFNNLRFAGGHIHVGYDTSELDPTLFARAMAYYLMHLHNQFNHRFRYYGYPGIFRPKPYGVEYRSLDNTFCLHDYTLIEVAAGLDRMRHDWEHNRQTFINNAINVERRYAPETYV